MKANKLSSCALSLEMYIIRRITVDECLLLLNVTRCLVSLSTFTNHHF